ncbi:mediator of DNA damage checkpoint protein 1 isoform X2 [Manis pentadactyla]|uniref:mediator of DNA damage checkpoint protein 1 isoform X2 n=1 Tax=Manis pentadactyla TaxID=143292 RepID=UPI001877088A|nr:mediator of DNA damage checkpoint protein 1 isoform X2 [Manis pentadactyla]KAI5136487.1 Mediator Of Dna Damage Checkpoint Protein 1 [Manis pentadactyla]
MEDTQAINWEVEEEEETERPSESLGYSLKPVGQLHIFSSAHGPEKDFPLYLGKNVIGRMPDCSVALPFPSISKQHAVIEILALDKAPVLRDCGSLNGTQILRPPKVLSPGMSHRLRDQELILFADLPCQYRRLDVPLPHVSWGPLTVEETPRVQGRTQPQELLLAENSEEEVDSLPERCVVKGPRTSPLASVVPESDEEGPSPAPDGPGPPFAFNLDSDTDEEQRQRPAVGKFSSAARRGATAETEQPKTVSTETQLEKDQCSVKERNKKRTVERDAKKGAVPVGVILEMSPPAGEDSDTGAGRPPGRPAEAHLERAQLSGFIDSDTDVEEEEIPATPAVVPTKKRHIFYEVSIKNSQAPGLAHQQESQTGSDTDVEEGEATLASPLERSQASMLIGSNTGLEEEVSAALTLAQLKESRAIPWSRDTAVEEDRAQPAALLEQSQTPIVRVSDTDVEEEGIPVEKRGTVPKSHTYKAHSEKSQPLLRDSDIKGEEDESLPEVPLERSQASATVDVSTQVEEKVPLGPAVTLLEKRQVLVAGTSQTDVEAEDGPADLPKVHLEEAWSPAGGYRTDVEGGTALAVSAVADVRGSRLLAEGDAETEWAVLEQERALEAGAQDSEDLYLQATQCFVERQDESREDALEEPWEVLATQPFCPRESEASEPQPIAAHLDIHGSCPFPPGATPQDQHPKSPVHAEPLGREMHTVKKDMGHLTCKMPPAEKASRGDQQSPDACLPPSVPKASDPQQNPPFSQSQKHPAPQSLLSPSPPSLEPPIPKARKKGRQQVSETSLSSELEPLHPKKPKVRPQGASRMTPSPVSSVALEPQPATPTYHPLSPKPTSRVTRNRTYRSSEMTTAPVVPLAQELQSSTSMDQPVTLMPISWAARTRRSSVKTPESVVPTAPEPQPSTSRGPPVTPKPLSQGSTHKSVKTPKPVVLTGPELQTSTPTDQLVTSELTFRATQGRALRSSAKTPEQVVPTGPKFQPSTSTDQPVTPKLTSLATRGRARRSSAKTPNVVVPTGPELQPSTSTDQPVTHKPTSRGRTQRSSVKTPEPIIPTAPELQAPTLTDQPITLELTSRATRGRTHRSSAKTLEPTVPTAPELQPSTSIDQPVTPEPTSRASQGKTRRPSIKSLKPMEPTAPDLEPPTFTEQLVALKAIAQGGQSNTLKSSTISAVPVPTTSEFQSPVPTGQPISPKPIPQANCSRRPRATRKHGSLTAPVVLEPCSAPAEPNSCSRNQRRGAVRAAESLRTTPDPAFAQLPEAPIHAPQMQKVEAAGRSGATPEPQSKSSQSRKRSLATRELETPLQKQLQRREVPQKTAFFKEEEDPTERPGKEEDVVIPGPGKRKKDQEEEEPPKGIPSRSLRRTKPNQESTAPKVLFTGVVDARGEHTVLALGGSLASSVAEASHLVTDRIRRTVKFLCALGRGIPILSLDWLHQSRKAGYFLPPDKYVVIDPEQEKNFGFSLQDALSRARKRRLLEGYEIHVTPGVQPPPPQMGEIISCCGGTVLPSMPRSYKPHRVVITCSQDFPRCSTPCRVGLPILSPEFLLTGVLKQEAKPEAFVLSTLKTSST